MLRYSGLAHSYDDCANKSRANIESDQDNRSGDVNFNDNTCYNVHSNFIGVYHSLP
jgi:hypothetical protein